MATFRVQRSTYYPTNTLLADGRVLVITGSHDQHIHLFGGLKGADTAPLDSAIFRYGNGQGGRVDPAVRTSNTPRWPPPRVGHSAVFVVGAFEEQTRVFGGKDSTGEYMNDLWELTRKTNGSSADYDYPWSSLTPGGADPPSARWRHSAVDISSPFFKMAVFGGTTKDEFEEDVASNEVKVLYQDFFFPEDFEWRDVEVTNPSPPSGPGARTGHASVWHAQSGTMLMFGGRSTPTGDPTDNDVWKLAFNGDFSEATWTKLTVSGTPPNARSEFAVAFDPEHPFWDTGARHLYLFGGEVAGGKSNELWKLRVRDDLDALTWTKITSNDTPPSPRSQHSLTSFLDHGMLYVFGGKPADDTVYFAHRHVDSETWHWNKYKRNDVALTGHTATFHKRANFQRKPELFSPDGGDGSWTTLNAPRLSDWYTLAFAWKQDSAFIAGPDIVSHKLALSNPSWTPFPSGATPGFRGGTAAMYRPGKLMKAGSRDTDGAPGGNASGTTKSVDLNAGASAEWRASSNSMAPRVNHNLVILPNGEVLVVGGTSKLGNEFNNSPEKRTEMWDPDYGGGAGLWHGLGVLDTLRTMRDYHSTAVLLPDGRVLAASGNADHNTRQSAEIYCPPYLFDGNSPATRPTLLGATERWRYGADVTFSASGDTAIRRVCLIRPAATTHSFDQAQRYVPLTLLGSTHTGGGVRQYFLEAPPDSFVAPPGDYLLFASNTAGVPSVARWVRVGSATAGQNDQGPPDELIFSTTFIYCDEISPIYWNTPGDDGSVGTALDYDIRYSFSPITANNFSQATPMSNVGIPLLAGTSQTGSGFAGLNPATVVYVAGKTSDRVGLHSSIAFAEFGTLPSCGGGGYGTSTQRSRDGEGASWGPRATAAAPPPLRAFSAPSSMLTEGSTLRLASEYDSQDGTPRWRLLVVDLAGDQALLQASSAHAVVQHGSVASGWSTQSSTALSGGVVGIRTLPAGGRIIFPAGAWIESVDLDPRGYECTEVLHSRLGDLSTAADSSIAGQFTLGDSLLLAFSPAAGEGSGAGFFRVRVPGEARATAAGRPQANAPRTPDRVDLPVAFALHPVRPNPFSASASIRFDLPVAEHVRLEVFDVQGRRIATVLDEDRAAGQHTLTWSGEIDSGRRAPAGVYLCRMRAAEFRAERRVALLP